MAFYPTDLIYILSVGNKYLSVDRSNLLLRELPLVPGAENNPGLCFQGDEVTGLWNNAEGEITVTSLASKSFTFTRFGFRSWDKFGKNILFSKQPLTNNRTILFPDADGTVALEEAAIDRINNEASDTIFKGMPVKVDDATGILKALGDAPANYALGLASEDTIPTGHLQVVYRGQFTQTDWTNVTGTTLLTVGQRYYVDNTVAGKLLTSGSQLIGIAITTTTLLLRIG